MGAAKGPTVTQKPQAPAPVLQLDTVGHSSILMHHIRQSFTTKCRLVPIHNIIPVYSLSLPGYVIMQHYNNMSGHISVIIFNIYK